MATSRFAAHVRVWLVVAPVLVGVLAPMLSDDRLFEVRSEERESVETLLGIDQADELAENANAKFKSWFIDTGSVARSFEGSRNGTMFGDGGASAMGSQWMKHVWMQIYRAIYRAAVASEWLLGAMIFAIAMLNDGAVQRRIRAAAAGVASPVAFHVASHGLVFTFGISALALLLPFTLPALSWSLVVGCIGALSWRIAASFHVNR